MSLAWRELDAAIRALAGPGTQRQRLQQACSAALVHLRRKELPAEAHAAFDLLWRYLDHAYGDPAAVRRALATLDDAGLAGAADAIIRMHDAVTRYQPIPHPAR